MSGFAFLTIDLQPKPEHDHNLTVFDELAQQCDAVLHLANLSVTIDLSPMIKPSRSTFSTTNSMINDYERRFQRSLQKLTIPSWYTESSLSPKLSDKPSMTSITHPTRDTHRTPEIVHVRRPQSYRSCRSSLTTSPSPSAHSWHPHQMIDGLSSSHLLPSSSSSTARRSHKYEKGIDRVAKSSRWYQPAQFVAKQINKPISKWRRGDPLQSTFPSLLAGCETSRRAETRRKLTNNRFIRKIIHLPAHRLDFPYLSNTFRPCRWQFDITFASLHSLKDW